MSQEGCAFFLQWLQPLTTSVSCLSVLIGGKELIKISDFGTSKALGGDQSTYMSFAGTVAWMAPGKEGT